MNKTLFRIASLFFFPQNGYAYFFLGFILLLFLGGTGIVYAQGGTSQPYVHFFYIPIILSALSYGLYGGLIAGIIATLIVGPWMPYTLEPLAMQPMAAWLFRGGFFILIGILTGLGSSLFRTFTQAQKTRLLTDPLTGLPNLRGVKHALDQATGGQEDLLSMAVVLIEIRQLWDIEKAIGAESTQQLLRLIACKLIEIIENKAFICYLETGSFVLTSLDSSSAAYLVARCRALLGHTFLVDNIPIFVEFYYGATHSSPEDTCFISTLRKAKVAAVKAMSLRQTAVFYAEDDDMDTRRNIRITHDLNLALSTNQLTLVYQPKYALKTNQIIGVEALARWSHPELGLLSPSEFIPLIESTLLINPFTKWVIKEAVHHMVGWRKKGLKISVAINFSMMNFQDPGILNDLLDVLQENNIPPRDIEIEVTETAVARNIKQVADILYAVREQGMRITIDDFGTGQSSMQYLCELPVDIIKIDKFFIQDMESNSASEAIVRSSVLLGHALNLAVVAEGIETLSHLEKLEKIGCDYGQGYLLAHPMPADELESFMVGLPSFNQTL